MSACMWLLWLFTSVLFLPSLSASNIGGTRQDILQNDDGGYRNILVAISRSVPEDLSLLSVMQRHFENASEFLFQATEKQVYFSNITILVPNTWTLNSSWEVAEDETFDKARILVGPANRVWGDKPYTLQPGLCGVEGDYIHYTPEYLTNGTAQGRNVVKEFSHLKWGLFDEDVSINEKVEDRFQKGTGKNYGPTRCGEYYGKFVNQVTGEICDINDEMMDPNCLYVPTEALTNFSILYAHHLPSITQFCSEETHYRGYPNRQNRLCEDRSAWEVMNNLSDFAVDHREMRSTNFSITLEIRIIQEAGAKESTKEQITPNNSTENSTELTTTQRMETTTEVKTTTVCPQDISCMALDVSGSMTTNGRVTKMSDAMKIYIQDYLRKEAAVGIVTFNRSAHILANITVVSDNDVRKVLSSVLPHTADGGTSISSGLRTCIAMVQQFPGNPQSIKRILLLSDGQDSSAQSILPELADLNIIIDTILYGQKTDEAVPKIALVTEGKAFYVSDEDYLPMLQQVMVDITTRGCLTEAVASVVNKNVNMPSTESSIKGTVSLDSTIGYNTTLRFAYSGTSDIDVNVTSAKGNNITVIKDIDAQVVKAVVAGDASGDEIEYEITKKDANDVNVVVSVTAKPVPNSEPIAINTRVDSYDINFKPNSTLNIFTNIFQGLTPVTNLTVHCLIKTSTDLEVKIESVDDGTGLDSTPNDGVYTASMASHKFEGSGYYSIQVEVDGEGIVPGSSTNRVKRCTDCSVSSLGTIQRTISGGVISVQNHVPVPDTTPPERIKDLSVDSGSERNSSTIFTLSWTAPGNDLNVGRASNYAFYVSNDSSTSNLQVLPNNHKSILTDVSSLLVDAGTNLELEIDFESLKGNTTQDTFYIRMTAEDDKGNVGDYSNLASLTIADPQSLFQFLEPTTTTTTTTTTTSTTTGPKKNPSKDESSSPEANTSAGNMQLVLGLSIGLGLFGVIVLAVVIIIVLKRKRYIKKYHANKA